VDGDRNRGGAMSVEPDYYWMTDHRSDTTARAGCGRDNQRETPYLVRRPSGNNRPRSAAAPRQAFDTERPGWLSRPDFTPVDTSQPLLIGPETDIDFTRPELWMNDDGEFR
jgi:hypothetical protein